MILRLTNVASIVQTLYPGNRPRYHQTDIDEGAVVERDKLSVNIPCIRKAENKQFSVLEVFEKLGI